MTDLGDLREGFWDQDELVQTALEVEREMPHLELAGVGTNLDCYGTVQATPEKMNQLVAVAERVEAAIGRKLDIISGGGDISETTAVYNGTVDFGVTWVSNLINANAGGMELLEVAQVYQRSGLVLVYKNSNYGG